MGRRERMMTGALSTLVVIQQNGEKEEGENIG